MPLNEREMEGRRSLGYLTEEEISGTTADKLTEIDSPRRESWLQSRFLVLLVVPPMSTPLNSGIRYLRWETDDIYSLEKHIQALRHP